MATDESNNQCYNSIDESPENLVTNLYMDEHGWLQEHESDDAILKQSLSKLQIPKSDKNCVDNNDRESNHQQGDCSIEMSGSSDSHKCSSDSNVVLFSGCKMLLKKLEVDPTLNDTSSINSTSEGETKTAELIETQDDPDYKVGECQDGVNVDTDHRNGNTEDLIFVNNLYDDLLRAVNELVRMRDAKVSKVIKEKYQNSNKKGGNNQVDSDKPNENDDNKEEKDWTEVKSKTEDSDELDIPKSASHLTQITFNTFSVLMPIVCKLINHPDRLNYNMIMKNGPRIRKKENNSELIKRRAQLPENIMDTRNLDEDKKGPKKSQTYLLFDHVYSITTVRALDTLRREVDRLLQCYPYLTIKSSIKPNTLWGMCSTSEEIIRNTFVFDKSRYAHINEKKSSEDQNDITLVDEFAKEFDAKFIQPLTDHSNKMVHMQEETIDRLHNTLTQVLSTRFRGVNLTVYGSCLSGLSLGKSSDVDISLFIPAIWHLQKDLENNKVNVREYEKKIKNTVYTVKNTIFHRGGGVFVDVTAVPFARVPVVKGTCLLRNSSEYKDDSINFDVCLLNDIAVANSKLLREYSLFDPRIRMLMLSIKAWSKRNNVGNAAENTLSSYSWMILVIFYLQCIEFVPVLQNPQFMAEHEVYHDKNIRSHCVNNLNTHFVTCEKVKQVGLWKLCNRFDETTVSVLLAGFFMFYARHFPKHTTAVSIRLGKCMLQKSVFRSARLWRLCIEDPFETHYSHCPHDLGTPMNEYGQEKVTKALTSAAVKMEHMFTVCSDEDKCGDFFNHVYNGSSIDVQNKKQQGVHTKQGKGHKNHNTRKQVAQQKNNNRQRGNRNDSHNDMKHSRNRNHQARNNQTIQMQTKDSNHNNRGDADQVNDDTRDELYAMGSQANHDKPNKKKNGKGRNYRERNERRRMQKKANTNKKEQM